MHKLAEKMAECLKAKVEGMGIDNIEGEKLMELGMWVDIIKDIAEYDKAMREIEEMNEEDGEEEDGRRGYRGQPRDSMGRFISRRGRRGYEEPMAYTMTPEMYHNHTPEYLRDMDREHGKMYYTESGDMGGQYASRMQRDSREGRSGQMRKGYMEAKEMGKEKGEKMKELEAYTKELAEDVTEMISGASPEEKNLLKTKMQTLIQKIQ